MTKKVNLEFEFILICVISKTFLLNVRIKFTFEIVMYFNFKTVTIIKYSFRSIVLNNAVNKYLTIYTNV